MSVCDVTIQGRRKIFWTTQPSACGVTAGCIGDCGSSGLETYQPEGQSGRTFRTTNFVVGLALNILLSDGRREDTACGWRPGRRGGHWADSFREDGLTIGTTIRDIPAQATVADSVNLIKVFCLQAMQKLVAYGVAQSVDVTVKYAGSNTFETLISIVGQDGETARVGITGNRIENSWVWGTN